MKVKTKDEVGIKELPEQLLTSPGFDIIEELESRKAPTAQAGVQFVANWTYSQPFWSPPTRFPGDTPINHNETLVADTEDRRADARTSS